MNNCFFVRYIFVFFSSNLVLIFAIFVRVCVRFRGLSFMIGSCFIGLGIVLLRLIFVVIWISLFAVLRRNFVLVSVLVRMF